MTTPDFWRVAHHCHICKRIMDVPGDPLSGDCGGDCVECMAQAGDPHCQMEVNKVRPGTYDIDYEEPT